ncbi:Disease resistance protein RPS4 [Cardamine amara subsp. amara]|uniref:Disease resistance protein RPS4 n=1 Tax=Cardamine amara subsp. amara TaxID=228776 RepID=A0ABD1ANC8_CARAN
MASSSSSSTIVVKVLSSPRVFVNFRGEELRDNFISHLETALEEDAIDFFIDNKLVPSNPIETLYKEIEDSKIALAVFSKQYAESKWCLNELVKIMDNVNEDKLKVIPIFFNVKVDDVKNQRGEFGQNLYQTHRANSNMPKWEEALKSVTAILGLTRTRYRTERDFIVDIVQTVKKVQATLSPESERSNMFSRNISLVTSSGNILSGTMELSIRNPPLYGIKQRLTQLEEVLFDFKYTKRRIVGIVGMSGIGKTTLAEEYYKRWNHTLVFNKYISGNQEPHWLNVTLLNGQELNDGAEMFTKKIFVVFDDVSKEQVDFLLEYREKINDGSKIVITTCDKSLIKVLADDIYVVPGLIDKDALQLFKDHAFDDQACSAATGKFPKLSKGFLEYVEGNPQALKELGKEIRGKDEDQWETRLKTLPHCCNQKMLTDLKLSYDKLSDQEKDAFLDIACFFRSEEEDYIKCLLDTESSEVVRYLAEKLLICISAGRIEMPNLLCTLGKELSSFEKNKLAERLWDHGRTIDILWSKHVKKDKNKVRGIFLDTSKFGDPRGKALDKIDFIERFNPQNLRYLKIYDSLCPQHCEVDCKVNLPEGLEFPFQEIRYLHWQNFPLEELPLDFNPKNLIDLRLPYSEIKRVWKAAKEAPRLKLVDLSSSKNLNDLSALSKAFNLRILNLEGCTSLIKLPIEMKNMKGLVFINLRGCVMLTSIPANLVSLKTLILSGCSKFNKFELSSENLEFLHLDGTAIKSLPNTIKNFQKLVLLNLKECKMLESLPYCLYKLKALEELILSDCVMLKRFPDIKENMENLQILLLDGTSIEEVPNILLHCVKSKDQVIFQQPLRMNGVSLLRRLCLRNNEVIRTLGSSISQLYHLKWIDLKYCKNLLSIPTLPPNLQCLDAHECSSLETVASPLALLMPTTQQVPASFIFTNCEKLDQVMKNAIVCYAHDKSRLLSEALNRHNKGSAFEALVTTCFPGNEVPAWFSNRASGAELEPELPGHWSENGFVGIALCAIVSFKDYKTRNNDLQLKCRCEFNDDETSSSNFNCHIGGLSETGDDEERMINSTHVFIGYTNWLDIKKCQKEDGKKGCVPTKASIKFEVTDGTNQVMKCEVLKCGFSLVYESGSWEASSGTECVIQGESILSSFLRGLKWFFK